MKKASVTLSIIILVLICLIGCKQDVEIPSANMGSITGKVFYSNGTDNSGILLTLDKTDGMRTISKEDGSRSVIGMCYSKEDGSFGFYNLEPGTYTVYASSNDSLEKAVSTNVVVREAETSTIESLQLTATGSISGTVSIDGSATGNSGFLVSIAGTSFMAVTNDGGKYTITGIPAGAGYQLIVSKGNYISSEVVTCAVQAKTTTNTGTRVISLNDIQTGNGTLVWKGSFASSSEIQNPVSLWAYYNTTDGCSYVFNGTEWTLLASKGDQGEQGVKGDTGDKGEKGDKGDKGETGTSGSNGSNGVSITWQGELPSVPDNPHLYWAYYNSCDGCSYIFDGENWTLLASKGAQGEQGKQGEQGPQGETGATGAQGDTGATGAAGANGVSIIWLGSFDSAPSSAVNLNAYYNNTDGCSYIYNGTSWTLLASKGAKGDQGEQGIQGATGVSGSNGVSITWKGSRASDPSNPELYWAYYNTEDGCSYIYDGNNWTLLASKGEKGDQGIQGATGSQGPQGETGATGASGSDGVSIIWLGSFSGAPADPARLNAYYNTETGSSYIYNGTEWELLASKGEQGKVGPQGPQGETGAAGADGSNGSDGISIIWKGELSEAPANPQLLWAYYNTQSGSSYIFNGSIWTLLAQKGAQGDQGIQGEIGVTGSDGNDGVSISWKGELSTAPVNPQLLWAYFNTSDGRSYIYNGTSWDRLSEKGDKGDTGDDGQSIVWKGEYSSAPASPQQLWAYHNTTDGNSYIYYNGEWSMLSEKGEQGHTLVVDVAVEPTCTETGLTTGAHCVICGYIYEAQSVIPATGHNYSITNIIAPTCTDRGYTSHVCSSCSDEQRDTYTEALGHSWSDEWSSDGSKHWHECERCGLSTTKLDHSYLAGVTTEVTCTQDGFTRHTCEICGYHYDDNHQDMLGHDYDSGNICTRCGYNKWQDNFIISGTTLTGFNGIGVSGAVTIPDGITAIGDEAFTGCSGITTLTIPDSIQSMGYAALYGCTGLVTLNLPFIGSSRTADGTIDGVFGYIFGTNYYSGSISTVQNYSPDGSCTYYIPLSLRTVNLTDVDVIPFGAFFGCIGITTINVAAGLSQIGDWSFGNCITLETVTIGDGIQKIGKHAFDGDSVLSNVIIAEGIRTIDDYAFQNCSSLTNVSLPSSVESKGHGIFYGCRDLNMLVIDVPEEWDTTNIDTILAENSGGYLSSMFFGDYSNAQYSWYLDDYNMVNWDGSPVGSRDCFLLGGLHPHIGEGTHIIKCVALIDGETYQDTYKVTASSSGIRIGAGILFYDCDADNDSGNADGLLSTECGWRFLEIAPADVRVVDGVPTIDSSIDGYSTTAETRFIFGYYRESDNGSNLPVGTSSGLGTGFDNTISLVNAMGTSSYSTTNGSSKTEFYAARVCDILEYSVNGVIYDDWFLPSKDELCLMWQNLEDKTSCGLTHFYGVMSSSEEGSGVGVWAIIRSDGTGGGLGRNNQMAVRPFRAF